MKRKNAVIITMAIVCIVTMIQSGVVFEDPFDNKNNWAKVAGTCTDVIQNGQYVITATETSEFKHTQVFQKITYSMDMKIETNSAQVCGILFCLQSNLDGYLFSLSANKQYNIGKYVGLNYTNIASNYNSFISNTAGTYNILTISKNGSDISLFCNNVFLEKISDNTFSQGDIGFYVGKGEKVAFNKALVIDTAEVGKVKNWFIDYFEDNDLFGWSKLQVSSLGGNVKSENGVMNVKADSLTIYYTNGAYKDMPCTTIVQYNTGSQNTFYGIIFLQIQASSVSAYYYVINSNKQYLVTATGGGTPKTDTRIHGTKDTLIVTADYDFVVNGNVLDNTTFSSGLNFNGVGIVTYQGATVYFDEFRAGINDGTPIINNIQLGPYTKNKPNFLLGGAGLIYDIRGRKVATFDAGYKAKLRELGAGHYYIVVPNGNQKHIIRQAIINTQ